MYWGQELEVPIQNKMPFIFFFICQVSNSETPVKNQTYNLIFRC